MRSVVPRWSPSVVAAFEMASGPWMRGRMRVRVSPLPTSLPADRPLLLVANHTSWWDGFVLRDVQRRLRPRAPLYTLITSEILRGSPALRWMGALDVGPASPGALRRALRFLASERAARGDFAVAMFPQGRLVTTRRRPLEFRRGLGAVARAVAPALVLPVALMYESFATSAWSAFVSLGAPIDVAESLDVGAVERAVTAELDRVGAFLDEHGEHAPALWEAT